ncbi:MAG: nitrite reductase [Desulfobulbaceae bacterium]|nr:nitrite reductase [Desulfobulbaceae bacterium]
MTKEEPSIKKSLTILIPEGVVATPILTTVTKLVQDYGLGLYLSTVQNLRLLDIRAEDELEIREALAAVGAELKGPGKFPLPKICVGRNYCNLGLIDTMALSKKILATFKDRGPVKPKFKIAISGCPAVCSDALLADIGIKATRAGLEVYAGGKGGPFPKIGRRIAKEADDAMVLGIIERLVAYHAAKTEKKQRFAKLMDEADFPFPEI